MKKTLKLFALLMVLLLALVGCSSGGGSTPTQPEDTPTSNFVYEEGTELRVAAGYQKANEAISFQDAEITGEGVTLADGVTYHTGDLKPTWAYLSELLHITFTDKFSGAGSADKEFAVWENQLDQVDVVAGGAATLNAAGAEDKLVNLADYLDQMPNFKAYLAQNQIARLSITGNTETGAIYFSPYFDGNDDIERMPLIRADFVRTLLDTDDYKGANRALAEYAYQPYATEDYSVESLTADGTGTQTIAKAVGGDKNIIAKMNAQPLTGDEAVKMFQEYIDATYAGVYAKRSDLFLGYDAAWDVDEMVALLRCAVASLDDNDGNPISGLYSRETSNLQRDIDLVRFAGSLFGVRGTESRQEYLYFDKAGSLHDGRQEAATYEAMEKMNQMVKEGLIITTGEASSANYLEKDAGLMSYDYNQTQTIYNNTKLQDGEEYIAIMVPVAKWDDGDGAKWMRFTESWRSVKTDGWAITKAGAAADENKLNAALALIDYAFSVQGQITMSYGPDSFIKVKDESVEVKTWDDVAKKYETFNFNGAQMPVVSDACFASCQELTGGNYTNYARRYLGSTLNGFPKSQAFEYQMTSEVGKKGSAVLAAAIGAGVIKHPLLAVNTANMWYTSVPTVLPTTAEQTNTIKGYADLTGNFQQAKDGVSVLYATLKDGYGAMAGAENNAAAYADFVKNSWSGAAYLMIRQQQWKLLEEYYNTLNS
jgi:putative aldouronate transport system substrate-binding protein